MIKRFFLFLTAIFSAARAGAQSAEMADAFRADGKIWVVIAVIVLIFLSLLGFLVHLERKLSRLEKQLRKDNNS